MPTRNPRVNVVVTEEQHALLSELARLDPATVRSASGFLREMLDQATPLLRITVPLMRAAAEEMDSARTQLKAPLKELLTELNQMELLDRPAPGGNRTERSEGGPPKRRARRSPRSTAQ
jgi:hypothetical protein